MCLRDRLVLNAPKEQTGEVKELRLRVLEMGLSYLHEYGLLSLCTTAEKQPDPCPICLEDIPGGRAVCEASLSTCVSFVLHCMLDL